MSNVPVVSLVHSMLVGSNVTVVFAGLVSFPSLSKNSLLSDFAVSRLAHSPVILGMISVVIFSCVRSLLTSSVGFIFSTVVVALSAVTRVASSSFLLPKQRSLRTPFASVTVYAQISPTFHMVSVFPLSEKFPCASAVA